MNLTVLLIAAYLPLLPVLLLILRSRSFGRGSVGTFLKLFFLGAAAAVPAFLMEAGASLAVLILLEIFPENAFGGNLAMVSAFLRYLLAAALIEEGWKHFVLRTSTWKQMTMETVSDGAAAAAVVGAGFSAVMYAAWQAGNSIVPAEMDVLHRALPDFLRAGAVSSFLFALLFVPSHFGFSGFMGALYGVAKRSEQKNHGGRAGFMLVVSYLLPVIVHGICAAMIGYGIMEDKLLFLTLGFVSEALLALLIMGALASAREDSLYADSMDLLPPAPVDFADSEEFADFAEAGGQAADHDAAASGTIPGEDSVSGTDPGENAAAEVENDGGYGFGEAAGTVDDDAAPT